MDWKRIKTEYIAGGTSYRKLCEKYGVSRTTLQRKAKDEKWLTLRSQAEAKTESKIIEAVSDDAAEKAVDIIDVADKLLGKIESMVESLGNDTQSLKQLTSALKDLKDIKGYKSPKDLEEQEARIEKYKRDAERDQDNGLTEIKVTFGSGEKDGQKWAE